MRQLMMYWFPDSEIKEYPLPEGYSFSNYSKEEDKKDWVEICKNGLVGDNATVEDFHNAIETREDLNPYEDMFFLDYKGEHIGTITAYVRKEDNVGDVHMVSIRTDFRGRGLGKFMNSKALLHLKEKGVEYAFLTTDDWRKGAVKSYLNAGFLPVKYSVGMCKRWSALLKEFNIPEVKMVKENAKFHRILKVDK